METEQHPSAYLLAEYTCEKCKAVEFIWNGRNGVTPFCVNCKSCDGMMQHTNWNKDRIIPDYIPPSGTRYFAELTHDRAKELAQKRVDSFNGSEFELMGDERDTMIEELTLEFLSDCCSMDILVSK